MKVKFKNIILVTVSVVLLTGITFFTACSKNEKISFSDENTLMHKFEYISPDMIGILHNECLKNDMMISGYFHRNNIESLKIDYDFFKNIGYFADLSFEELVSRIDTTTTYFDNSSLIELAVKVAEINNYTDQFIYYAKLINEFENVIDEAPYYENLNSIKDKIMDDNKLLSEEEQYVLLGGISVAIESRKFWTYEYPSIAKSINQKEETNSDATDLSTCENLEVAWEDVKGWFSGLFGSHPVAVKIFHTASIVSKNRSKMKHLNIVESHENK